MRNIALLTLLLAACGGDDSGSLTATAQIMPTTGNTATGTATFTRTGTTVSLTITVSMSPPGVHGMHIHHEPLCGPDGMMAGAHWDGMAMQGSAGGHGLPGGAMMHLGDLGNITIAADGTGTLTYSNPMWKLGDGSLTDVANRSIIFHANMDDGTMMSSGGRIGCGIIGAAQ
jgi:Cu-Zn family superoxide dismutase